MRSFGGLASPGAWSALMRAALVVAAATVGAVAVAGCGAGGGADEAETAPAPTITNAAWDLVAIGDSTPGGYGVMPDQAYTRVYARMLAEDLGVAVTVRDHATWAKRTLADWYKVVGTDGSLRSDLRGAEIVTLFVGPHDFGDAVLGGCTGAWPEPLETCFRATTAAMPRDFDRLLGAIRELVPKRVTILVGYDGGLPPAAYDIWSDKPYWPDMKRILVDEWRPGLRAAAKAHDARIIPFKDAMYGDTDVNLHPGFIQADGIHFNPEGHRFLAKLHAENDGLGEE